MAGEERRVRPGLLFVAWLLLAAAPASTQTEITDATVNDLLRRAEDAFRQGRVAEATHTVERVTAWAKHIRDVAPGSRNPPEEYAFVERISQRVLATIGRTFGADHETGFNALLGLATPALPARDEPRARGGDDPGASLPVSEREQRRSARRRDEHVVGDAHLRGMADGEAGLGQ